MNCENCGKPASKEMNQMLLEDNYSGDYFCSDECRDKKREREDGLLGYS